MLVTSPVLWLIGYLAVFLATALVSWVLDRRGARYQRNPASCHLLLGCAWPAFLGFFCCVAFARLLRSEASNARNA